MGSGVVLGGTKIPPRSLVAGVPAKVRREVTDELAKLRHYAAAYVEFARVDASSSSLIPVNEAPRDAA